MFIDPAIQELANSQFHEARQIFEQRVFNGSLMCEIYDAYVGSDDKNHNCLRCNLDDLTTQIRQLLVVSDEHPDYFPLHQSFALYSQSLNALWERICGVFEILSVPEAYRARHYSPFIRIRRWANFFKHPKEFGWLVHHPHYTIEETDNLKSFKPERHKFVTDDFLKKYYSADRAKGLASEFKGFENDVIVVLPDILQITTSICDCLENFVKLVTENPVYKEILEDKSTIINFLEKELPASELSAVSSPAPKVKASSAS